MRITEFSYRTVLIIKPNYTNFLKIYAFCNQKLILDIIRIQLILHTQTELIVMSPRSIKFKCVQKQSTRLMLRLRGEYLDSTFNGFIHLWLSLIKSNMVFVLVTHVLYKLSHAKLTAHATYLSYSRYCRCYDSRI